MCVCASGGHPKQLWLHGCVTNSDVESGGAARRLQHPAVESDLSLRWLMQGHSSTLGSRIEYIGTQASMGANKTELVDEQYRQLLTGFSMLRDVDLDGVSGISNHLIKQKVFSNVQLLAFSASLRAAAAAYQTKPTGRGMQSNRSLQHYLVQTDWDRLDELGKQPTLGSEPLEDIVALKMHALGMVCPDAE